MSIIDTKLSNESALELIKTGGTPLKEYLNALPHEADVKEFIELAPDHNWPELLDLIDDVEKKAVVVSEFEESDLEGLSHQLSPQKIVEIIEHMESDDATDFLAKLSDKTKVLVLKRLPLPLRKTLVKLLKYPEDSAGGIMQVELAQVYIEDTVEIAIACVKNLVEQDIEILTVWVVNQQEELVGSIALVDLLLNKATTPVKNILDRDLVTVQPLVDQEEVANIFKKYDLIALPVVDDNNSLLGRILIDDVMDVVSEEADEDALRMGGTSPEEFAHPNDVLGTVKLRTPWLAIALGCSLISALLLKFFEPTLQSAIKTLFFIPVVTAMGGNVGTQSSTVLIRSFATGKIRLTEIPNLLYREMRIGITLGIFYGVLSGFAAYVFGNFNIYLGLVVFFSMMCALFAAASMGIIAPTLLKKFNYDPAISTGPFVTTMNDITGILIYMSIATYFITYLN